MGSSDGLGGRQGVRRSGSGRGRRLVGLLLLVGAWMAVAPCARGAEPVDTSVREIVAAVDATSHITGLASYAADRFARGRLGGAEAIDMYQALGLANRRLLRNLGLVDASRQMALAQSTRDLLELQKTRIDALTQAATVEMAQGREAAMPWWESAKQTQDQYLARLLEIETRTDPSVRLSPGPICRANLNGDGHFLKVLLVPQDRYARLTVLDEGGRVTWAAPARGKENARLWFDFNPTIFWRLEVVNRIGEKKGEGGGEKRAVVEGEDILAEAERGAGLKLYRYLRWNRGRFVVQDEGYLLESPPGSGRLTWVRPDVAQLPLQPLGLAGRPLAVQDGVFLAYLMHGESFGRFALVTTDLGGFRILRFLTRDLAD